MQKGHGGRGITWTLTSCHSSQLVSSLTRPLILPLPCSKTFHGSYGLLTQEAPRPGRQSPSPPGPTLIPSLVRHFTPHNLVQLLKQHA